MPPRATLSRGGAECSPDSGGLSGPHVHRQGLHYDSAYFLGLHSLLIPRVPTFPRPELKVLVTSSQDCSGPQGAAKGDGTLWDPTVLAGSLFRFITVISVRDSHSLLYQPENSALRQISYGPKKPEE